MTTTNYLTITEVASGQNQKETTINNGFVRIDQATQGGLAVTFTANAKTLTTDQFTGNFIFSASNQTASATLTVPLSRRFFAVHNANSTYDIVVGGATGATVTVAPSSMQFVYCDGTDCLSAAVNAESGVLSVVGLTGAVTLSDLTTAGLAPKASPTFSGTIGLTGTTTVVNFGSAASVSVPITPGTTAEATSKSYVDAKTWAYSALPSSASKVPIPVVFSDKPSAGQILHIPLVIDLTIPANWSGAIGYCGTQATADATFTIGYIDSGSPETYTSIGTIKFTAGHVGVTLSTQSAVNLTAGQILKVVAPSPQDATLADCGFTILATRS